MYQTQSIENFLANLAANSATPGGGTVAALNGALGAALVSMVCNVTIGKAKYADVEEQLQAILQQTEILRGRLSQLADEDSAAFEQVMAAFKLPKETEAEKNVRAEAIQQAYKKATLTPLETAQACAQVLQFSQTVAQIGNRNAISDAGMGALAAQAGLKGAALNVLINLGSIKDEAFVTDTRATLEETLAGMDDLTAEIYKTVETSL